jgi:hypothetical protein
MSLWGSAGWRTCFAVFGRDSPGDHQSCENERLFFECPNRHATLADCGDLGASCEGAHSRLH